MQYERCVDSVSSVRFRMMFFDAGGVQGVGVLDNR